MKLNNEELKFMSDIASSKQRVVISLRNSFGQSFDMECYIMPNYDKDPNRANIRDTHIWMYSGINNVVNGGVTPQAEFACFHQEGWGFAQMNNMFIESIKTAPYGQVVYQNPEIDKLVETSKIVLEANGVKVDEEKYPQSEEVSELLGKPVEIKGVAYITTYAEKRKDGTIHVHAIKSVGRGALSEDLILTADSKLPIYEKARENMIEFTNQQLPFHKTSESNPEQLSF
jgi:hypothetical protein